MTPEQPLPHLSASASSPLRSYTDAPSFPHAQKQTLTCPRGANSCSSWPPAHLQTSVQTGEALPCTVVATCFAPLFHQWLSVLLVLVPADARASQLYPAWSLPACARVSAALHLSYLFSQRRQWPGGATWAPLPTYGCLSLSFTNRWHHHCFKPSTCLSCSMLSRLPMWTWHWLLRKKKWYC